MQKKKFASIYNHLSMIEKLREDNNITKLFTTHNLFFVENWADKILVLNEGKNVFEGAPNEGLSNSDIRKILGSYDDIFSLLKK